MTITYKLEPADLRAFQRYTSKHRPSVRRFHYLFGLLANSLCLWLTLSAEDHRIGFRVVYFLLLMSGCWLVMRCWTLITTRIAGWRFCAPDKHRAVLCEHTMSLADDALIDDTPFNMGRIPWEGVYQVVDTFDHIYIFTSLNAAHIIPKRAFPDIGRARQFYERAASLESSAKKAARIARANRRWRVRFRRPRSRHRHRHGAAKFRR